MSLNLDEERWAEFEQGELRFSADYVRGRCVKTDITVRADGTTTLATRGQARLPSGGCRC